VCKVPATSAGGEKVGQWRKLLPYKEIYVCMCWGGRRGVENRVKKGKVALFEKLTEKSVTFYLRFRFTVK
jgi:hypothetical protein